MTMHSDFVMLKHIFAVIASDLAERGETDLSLGRLKQEFLLLVDVAQGRSTERSIVVDHTDTVLRQARLFRRAGELEIASVFYATWIEHRVNEYWSRIAFDHGLSQADTDHLIRGTSLRAKLSFLHLVKGGGVSAAMGARVEKLSELRNAFVHYKWKPENKRLREEYDVAMRDAEAVVRHFRYFERKYLGRISERKAKMIVRAGLAHEASRLRG